MNGVVLGPHPPPPPHLVSVSAASNDATGDLCAGSNWHVIVSWTTTNPDDVKYQIDIQGLSGIAGSTTNQTTASSSWDNDTGFQGNKTNGPFDQTQTASYRVKLVRKSDSVVIEQLDTNTASMAYSLNGCA